MTISHTEKRWGDSRSDPQDGLAPRSDLCPAGIADHLRTEVEGTGVALEFEEFGSGLSFDGDFGLSASIREGRGQGVGQQENRGMVSGRETDPMRSQ